MNPMMMKRKKVMDAMMKDGPAVPVKKKPAMGEMMEGAEEQEGMEQMMVTAEEKQMILEMRAGHESEESAEGEHDPMMAQKKKPAFMQKG